MAVALSSVVLPVYNQEAHVERVVVGYLDVLSAQGRPFELVLVTNGCTDRSVEISSGLADRHETVRHVDLPEAGWGRAVKAGLAHASGSTLCYTNSARTSPETLVLMLLYAAAYPNVVLKANRRIRDNWRRRVGGLLYNLECRVLFDIATWDVNGTPKVFPRAFEKLLALTSDGDLIDLEFVVTCKRESYPILEVPIPATRRHGGRSTTNYASAIAMYAGAYRMARAPRRGRGGAGAS